MNELAKLYIQTCKATNNVPFIEELAFELDVCRDTIYEWTRVHSEFSYTIGRLRLLQELELKKGALSKKFQSHIAIFLLKANHGLSDIDPEKSDRMVAQERKKQQSYNFKHLDLEL